ncbi:MAG: molybdopterin molybdotransferase MoeA [Rothia sp. (in: high G+C Gram-positive bacteria)]|uniref:molybdopterin molybdotransferase MoeA n=1 Tax=Rothia sp. (in: high G+C Gram-positive bacteria) TaxID=1885016 RepID=UPI0026E0C9DE|nr:molybdopterin molybdotransferase MoeA [Rothia sp. (in: high G+C Gram-positive bacteria)]MDO5749920.1 molybdopterin molybdotransferase MoeA [Rothia sp. (in: high G+C Gram-positive bacteria)]
MSYDHPPALSWNDARETLYSAGQRLYSQPIRHLPLRRAIGSTLAKNLRAMLPIPHYDSSAMDGYAIAGPAPWRLIVPEYPDDSRANIHRVTLPLTSGQATPIYTGGLLPAGAEAIVRTEHSTSYTQGADTYITMADNRPVPAPGADMRYAGSELATGDLLAERGTLITARMAAFLSVNGFDELPVFTRPTVQFAFTGNEVITSGLPGPGQVRDAFGSYMESMVESAGFTALDAVRLPDDPHRVDEFLATSYADIMIFTGGSSTSGVDQVRTALARANASYLFESVDIRPGHPALAAVLPAPANNLGTGHGGVVLGLPGNPLAAYTALCSYLPPLLAGIYGKTMPQLETMPLSTPIAPFRKAKAHTFQRLVPVAASGGAVGALPKHASHMLSSFARSTHLALLGPEEYSPGQSVPVLPVL